MKTIFIFLIVVISFRLMSQSYQPFNFENGIWVQTEKYYGGLPTTYINQYYAKGDTLIHDVQYFKLMNYKIYTESGPDYGRVEYDGYFGAIRNTNDKKVEFIHHSQEEPVIIYDFNLEIGDTIKNGYGSFYYDDIVVVSTDSVQYCGNYHKRFNLNDSSFVVQALIEGIGFTSGFINPFFRQFEQNSELLCYKERNNNECDDCELILSNLIINNSECINVFPNPFSNVITIHLNSENAEKVIIEIYDVQGRKLSKIERAFSKRMKLTNVEMNINNVGTYLIKIQAGNNIYTYKMFYKK